MAQHTSLAVGSTSLRRGDEGENIIVAPRSASMPVNNTADRDVNQRVEQLELNLAEQAILNSDLQEDIKSLKTLQNGDRMEYKSGFRHCDEKKKKFYALLDEVNNRITAIEAYQEQLATRTELQHVFAIPCH